MSALGNIITLARVFRSAIEAGKHALLDVTGRRDDSVPHWQPYGFQAAPLDGSTAVQVAVGGAADSLVTILVHDRRYTIALADGDVALVDFRGNRVLLGPDGISLSDGTTLIASDGVLNGMAIDPFTGATHFALGNASALVRAKK